MLRFTAPSAEELRAWSASVASATFNYPGVGSTRDLADGEFVPPRGFQFDRRRTRLGEGEELFEAAADAVMHGRMFPSGWFRAALPPRAVVVGDILAIAARCGGMWWANAARVVYVIDEHVGDVRRRGFAYGTLPAHVERGEERFVAEQLADGSVWYDLAAFSRPRHPLIWATYPLARWLQERFRRESAAALETAVAATTNREVEKWLSS
jgi:uncharacterized protein (UPF0548 family)